MAGSRRAGRDPRPPQVPLPEIGGGPGAGDAGAPPPGGRRKAKPPRLPDPEPIEVDDSLVIAVGTIAWAITFVVLLVLRGPLEDRGNEWWPWTAAAGLGLGLWGWWLVRKRIAARNAARRGTPEVRDEP